MNVTATLSACVSSGNAPAAPVSWLMVPIRIGSPVALVAVFGRYGSSVLPAGAHSTMDAEAWQSSTPRDSVVVDRDGSAWPEPPDSLHAPATRASTAIEQMNRREFRNGFLSPGDTGGAALSCAGESLMPLVPGRRSPPRPHGRRPRDPRGARRRRASSVAKPAWSVPSDATARGIHAEWRMKGTACRGAARVQTGPPPTSCAAKTSTRNPASLMTGTTTQPWRPPGRSPPWALRRPAPGAMGTKIGDDGRSPRSGYTYSATVWRPSQLCVRSDADVSSAGSRDRSTRSR